MDIAKLRLDRRMVVGGLIAAPLVAQSSMVAAQQPSGTPIRVGGTLPLTGPLASLGLVHKIAGEVFRDVINAKGGLLGRPLELVILDDQSQPATTRTLYERLVTADKVDLLMGPYGTGAILAAMGVAQRYNKLFIQSSLGDPALAPYDRQFPSLPLGPDPRTADTEILLDAYASAKTPPKSMAIVTSKFPSALDLAKGGKEVAEKRGMTVPLFLEYEFGTKDFGAIASRVKDAAPDLLWMGSIGLEAGQLLDAMKRLEYVPARHFYLFPATGPTATNASANGATSLTWFEEHAPFTEYTGSQDFAKLYNERAAAASLPWPRADYQAAVEYAAWQILAEAVTATKSLDDAVLTDWLKKGTVETVVGTQTFTGKFNSGPVRTAVRQVQNGKWVAVWPLASRAPGTTLIAP